jgi:hypothetical protein
MESMQATGEVFRKIVGITLIGFLVVVLIGPILTVLGVLLPFALVGLLVYVPYRLFLAGKHGGWPAVRAAGQKTMRTAVVFPLWLGGKFAALISFVLRTVFRLIGTLFGLVFAVGTGAVLGATLGAIGGMQFHDAEYRVPAGALIGASVGLVAVLWRSKPSRVVIRPAPQVQQVQV